MCSPGLSTTIQGLALFAEVCSWRRSGAPSLVGRAVDLLLRIHLMALSHSPSRLTLDRVWRAQVVGDFHGLDSGLMVGELLLERQAPPHRRSGCDAPQGQLLGEP